MCSRVCGIGPSAADTTRIAPSIWAAPVIMFLMKSAWPGTVDVGVVPLVGLVLDVADGDRHRLGFVADRTALGDIGVRLELRQALGGLHRQDRAGGRGLAVIDVADRADVDVRLRCVQKCPWPFCSLSTLLTMRPIV